jgi:hypothetical protein
LKSFLLLAALGLTGCYNDAESTAGSSNAKFEVQRLFTVDGCTVYRFTDAGVRYFANCRGSVSADHFASCGKNCTHRVTDEIPTGVSP